VAEPLKESAPISVIGKLKDQANNLYDRNSRKYGALNTVHLRHQIVETFANPNEIPAATFISITLADLANINDTLGHDAGNNSLRTVSPQIQQILDELHIENTVYHDKSGDFLVKINGLIDPSISEKLAIAINAGDNPKLAVNVITTDEIKDILPENCYSATAINAAIQLISFKREISIVKSLSDFCAKGDQLKFYTANVGKYFPQLSYVGFLEKYQQGTLQLGELAFTRTCDPDPTDSDQAQSYKKNIKSKYLQPENSTIENKPTERTKKDNFQLIDAPLQTESVETLRQKFQTNAAANLETINNLGHEINSTFSSILNEPNENESLTLAKLYTQLEKLDSLLRRQGTCNEVLDKFDFSSLVHNHVKSNSDIGELIGLYQTLIATDELVRDKMTGFINSDEFSRQFDARINQKQKEASQNNKKLVVLGLDINMLNMITKIDGRATGDLAILITACGLEDCSDLGSIIARTGGDELYILFESTDEDLEAKIDQLKSFIDSTTIPAKDNLRVPDTVQLQYSTISVDDAISEILPKVESNIRISDNNRTAVIREICLRFTDAETSDLKSFERFTKLYGIYERLIKEKIENEPSSFEWAVLKTMIAFSQKALRYPIEPPPEVDDVIQHFKTCHDAINGDTAQFVKFYETLFSETKSDPSEKTISSFGHQS